LNGEFLGKLLGKWVTPLRAKKLACAKRERRIPLAETRAEVME